MMEKNGSLKSTEPGAELHRVYFEISTTGQWYAIMGEARTLYGKNWKSQAHVKKKLDRFAWHNSLPGADTHTTCVWFEVPDPKFTTWVSMKLTIRAVDGKNK